MRCEHMPYITAVKHAISASIRANQSNVAYKSFSGMTVCVSVRCVSFSFIICTKPELIILNKEFSTIRFFLPSAYRVLEKKKKARDFANLLITIFCTT